MREIVFRGKDIDNKGWVYGALVQQQGHPLGEKTLIISYSNYQHGDFSEAVTHEVDPATVGQYTGLVDKNGEQIFEGDIIMQNDNRLDLVQVCFGEFGVRDIDTEDVVDKVVGFYTRVIPTDAISQMAPFCYDMQLNDFWIKKLGSKVIGNIYDNPELLKDGALNDD